MCSSIDAYKQIQGTIFFSKLKMQQKRQQGSTSHINIKNYKMDFVNLHNYLTAVKI